MNGALYKPIILSLVLGCIIAAACTSTSVDRSQVEGVVVTLVENAHDGDFELSAGDARQFVDVNSTLQLRFEQPPKPGELEQEPAWKTLAEALRRINEVALKFRRLSARAQELESNLTLDQQFVDDAQAAQDEAVAILQFLVKPSKAAGYTPLLTDAELTEIALGDEVYRGLVKVLNEERDTLRERAATYAAAIPRFDATVTAFLYSPDGGMRAIHVPGYDYLPLGELQPTRPAVALPTVSEYKRLRSDLEAAQRVEAVVNQVRRNSQLAHAQLSDAIDNLSETPVASVPEASLQSIDELFSDEFLTKLDGSAGSVRPICSNVRKEIGLVIGMMDELDGSDLTISIVQNRALSVLGVGDHADFDERISGIEQCLTEILNSVDKLNECIGNDDADNADDSRNVLLSTRGAGATDTRVHGDSKDSYRIVF